MRWAGPAGLVAAALLAAWAALAGWAGGIDRAGVLAMAGGPVALWGAVATSGDTLVRLTVAAGVAAVLIVRRRASDALRLALAIGGGSALNTLLKDLVQRPRPALLPQLDRVDGWSLPSGHAAGAMTLGLALALLVPARHWPAATALAMGYAAAVGVSRVALAVHWPSDVLVGWLWGAGWTLLVMRAGTSPRDTGTRAGSRP